MQELCLLFILRCLKQRLLYEQLLFTFPDDGRIVIAGSRSLQIQGHCRVKVIVGSRSLQGQGHYRFKVIAQLRRGADLSTSLR